ncbi:protein eyes shut homolog [Xyrauchen texanus]|uniref:protein eyes shut homolog n=1 Tax=Xyrauchen texanus TaxID=154827 RepID=UPI002241A67C|nr:protein eyes shut homolog [Xyrauchen texanus]
MRNPELYIFAFLLSCFTEGTVYGQVACRRSMSHEWHTQARNINVRWTLMQNSCRSLTQCWTRQMEADRHSWTTEYHFPQLCPLDLQLGDVMFVSTDRTLEQYGVYLIKVSKEEFDNCLIVEPQKEQLVFANSINGTVQVEPKWLMSKINYFTVVHRGSSQLCRLGLRIAVLVKAQHCKSSPLLRLCSGNGECRTTFKDDAYSCHCHKRFSGHYCENFDGCYDQPCLNGGTCLSKRTAYTDLPPYECLCHAPFTGVNCSEIIGHQNCIKGCKEGACLQVSSTSYRCECLTGYTGTYCEHKWLLCDSNPCWNDGHCEETANGYVCTCPGGFTGLKCETTTEVDSYCKSNGCQLDEACAMEKPNSTCICVDLECSEQTGVCGMLPCLNGGICVAQNGQYRCRCQQGFSGKNCEEVIDFCKLFSINCLNEGLCLNLVGGYNCLCAPGWMGEFCQYVDNACLAYPNRCINGATCISMSQPSAPPHYTCTCLPGYTGRYCEAEINECDSSPCQHQGTCADFVGYYKCTCRSGFTGVDCEVDIDACALPNVTCPPGTFCVDLQGELLHRCHSPCPRYLPPCANGGHCVLNDVTSYSCVCAPGWAGTTCLVNINECVQHRCQNGATCADGVGGYRCLCDHGYTGVHCELDIDFCGGHQCSEHGVCIDQQHNYTCHCMLGYEGMLCEFETDECKSSPCANGATCIDLVASYQCLCTSGFHGRTCSENMNECWSRPCLNGGTCIDLVNDYICICPLGFTGHDCFTPVKCCTSNPCDTKGTSMCEEQGRGFKCLCHHGYMGRFCETSISYCVAGLCLHGSNCVDRPQGFTCECLPGLTGRFCEVNIDDCLDKPCGALSICKDGINAYDCFCAPGFIGDNCEIEVNECLSQPCQNGASCSDELSSFSCLCPAGTTGNLCEINIDECQSSPCMNNGTCLDLSDGFKCICPSGFTGMNCEFLPCEAVDPCENGAECVEEADSVLFPLGFRCRCRRGFTGPRCEINIDECSSSPCLHGFCYDVVDGFYCLCNPGYAGMRCEQDINDCASNMCENNSTCMDLHLSYNCLCLPGWEGEFCQRETDECSSNPCKNNATCTDMLNGYRCTCPHGWTGLDCGEDVKECASSPCLNGAHCVESDIPGEFSCTCPPFFTGPLCEQPYNPCDLQNNPCLHNSACRARSDGTTLCVCPDGFEGTRCEIDSDECVSRPCQNQGRCVDGVNSYSCFCNPGFSGQHCEEDINECASNPCQKQGICQDLVNGFHCNCVPGYFGTFCNLDINECESSPCLHDGVCINKPGGFVCVCSAGFSGTWCELNIDECQSNPCQNNGKCIDGYNGYQCVCSRGFTGNHCESNIDECSSNPCVHGSCLDEIDAYNCQCEVGWTSHRCEININECETHPCLNGGSCVDLLDKYACICADGFTGKNCDIDQNVCLQMSRNFSLCFNGGTCVDGPGANFTCSCLPGFVGDFCEVEMNECCSEPCFNGAICQDLINGYQCHCRPGWTGLHCEDDINECFLQPCNQGMCIQNEPGHGYTCFCRPGFVGKNCEYNYDDCLIRSCPDAFSCVDGINNVSCVPVETVTPSSPPISVVPWITIHPTPESPPTAAPVENLQNAEQPTDIIFGKYSGNSFLEFAGIEIGAVLSVTVRFQTNARDGTLLYSDQGPVPRGVFFIKLYIYKGTLKYDFSCNQKEGVQHINTEQQVSNGNEYVTFLRQHLAPCVAEVTVTGFRTVRSIPSNYTLPLSLQRTKHLFIGGLPLRYAPYMEAEPFHNYTGCIEIIEINKLRGFSMANAIARNNVDNCRSPWHHNPPVNATDYPSHLTTPPPTQPSLVCQPVPCFNGGVCRSVSLPSGALSFFCDCPLHFTGHLCEKDTSVFFPRFDGRSFLELPPLTSLLQSDSHFASKSSEDNRTVYLTMKSKTLHGTILYTREQNFGDRFLHVFLQNGRPVARLGCSASQVLSSVAYQNVANDSLVPVTVRYALPSHDNGQLCIIEIAVANGTVNRQQKYMNEPVSEVVFGSTFLGGVPSLSELHHNTGNVSGFFGCIHELQIDSKELYVMGVASRGQNIQNCDLAVCQHQPCRNGGTCVSDAENWFCVCPLLYFGKLCQFTACERNPCAHGATCVPQMQLEAACLCPYGRQGLLCDEVVNVTRPRFSGLDEFGYSSYVAYPPVPNMSHFYEFHLKLTFTNNASALRNNLILFSGQKGQGIRGDDFFALGVQNGRIVHKYNLGSGLASIVSERLNPRINIHTVHFGRYLKNGWLKVDGQKIRTGTSPGPLAGFNTFSQLYVGGYEEYTPELLPAGSRFQNSFQGCIFDVLFRTRRNGKFNVPGGPDGRPASGRNVGQCGVNPCSLVICQNGGACVDSGSSVHCQCVFGWKGALCSQKVSFCDAEHIPPPSCAHGSTCVPFPEGYTCQCPLGTAGRFCQQALSISDPFFSGNKSSWMSFPPVNIRHRTHLQLQFQSLSPEGILFYTARYLSRRSGDFLSVSLSAGYVQLRYNLGNETIVVQSPNKVDLTGMRWHTLKAGREGNRGFLVLDNEAITRNSSEGPTTLDVSTNIFIGGFPSLNAISLTAMEKDPVGFTGGIREVIVNGHDIDLTETGALDGTNVGDWDGTACGYKVCLNGGYCHPVGLSSFMCICSLLWTGSQCQQSMYCNNNLCQHGSLCVHSVMSASYSCMCALGWNGTYCDQEVSLRMMKFSGNSYLKYKDPKYNSRNLLYTEVSLNFSTSSGDGLILWMGKAESEDDDHLAVGLHDGYLKVSVNLGERTGLPLFYQNTTFCCDHWNYLSIIHNRTIVEIYVNEERVIFEDIDPYEQYVAINYEGVIYFGGFELNRDTATVTSGLFTTGFVGSIKDVFLFQDTRQLQFLQSSEGYGVSQGEE